MNKLKVGDIVTSKYSSYWLKHYHARIKRIVNINSREKAILEIFEDLGTDKSHQWIEGHKWDLDDLKLVEIYENKPQIKNNINKENDIVKENVEFKVGDRIKIRKDLVINKKYDNGCVFVGDMNRFKGKVGTITEIRTLSNRFDIDLDDGEWSWSPSMLDLIEEKPSNSVHKIEYSYDGKTTTVTLPDGRVGKARRHPEDKHKEYEGIMIAMARAYGVEPPSKIGIATVVDEVTITKEEDFKVGDHVAWRSRSDNYDVCKIEKIEKDNIWGYWREGFKEIPKTLKEFESAKANSFNQFCSKSSAIKLSLQDEKPKFEVGQKVTMEDAKQIIESGGSIKLNSDVFPWVYYLKDKTLMFKNLDDDTINISSGYENLKNDDLVVYQLSSAKTNNQTAKEAVNEARKFEIKAPTPIFVTMDNISEETIQEISKRVLEELKKGLTYSGI